MTTSFNVLWSSVAENDLVSIISYIQSNNPLAARKSLGKIKSKVLNLEQLPQRGRVVPELLEQGIVIYREIVVSPWRVIYRIDNNLVYILGVIDSRQSVEDVLLGRLVRGSL